MDDVLKLFGIMLAIGGAGSIVYVVVALANALVRRLDGGTSGATEQLEAELGDLRARLDDADAARHRIAELEERLDFAERMLAQQREHPRLGTGGAG